MLVNGTCFTGDWPLSIDEGTLWCYPAFAITTTAGGTEYPLSGLARGAGRFPLAGLARLIRLIPLLHKPSSVTMQRPIGMPTGSC